MRLLVLDIEGTLFKTSVRLPGTQLDSTIWQAIAHSLGPSAVAEEVATHQTWATGGYQNYLDWMTTTIEIHVKYGLRKRQFDRLIKDAEYNSGVPEFFSRLDRTAFVPVLISGGFRELAARAQRDLNVRHAFAACEYLFDSAGVVSGFNLLPCDFHGKLAFVRLMLSEYRLSADQWVFVGDGLNDVPIASAAPVSIAYRAHPELAAVSTGATNDWAEVSKLLGRV